MILKKGPGDLFGLLAGYQRVSLTMPEFAEHLSRDTNTLLLTTLMKF